MENKKLKKISLIAKTIIIISSLVGFASIIIEYGFNVTGKSKILLHNISISVVFVFILYQAVMLLITKPRKNYIKTHRFELFFSILVFVEFLLTVLNISMVKNIGTALNFKNIAFLYVLIAQFFIIVGLVLGGLRYNSNILKSKIHPSRLFVISFLVTIITGALLLMLPAATTTGNNNFVDALFTSTSAVCVTGLISVDTATYYTQFGQIVIMMLFQVGGLGLMTFTTFFAIFLSGGMGIKERILLHDLLDEENIGAITRILVSLIAVTFIIELAGAIVLFSSSYHLFPDLKNAIFSSVFHSISAFCNAGFSIFTLNLMDPGVRFDYSFITTISFLIILGGIGFPTILNFFQKKNYTSVKFRMPLQTKIIIYTTFSLIIIGTIATYLLEINHSLKGLSEADKLFASYFQSVSSRTAGFNTLDFSQFSVGASFFYLFLMFVGASPGGTGGGIKTTAFIILMVGSWSLLKNQKNVTIGNRTIPRDIVLKAFLKFFFTMSILTIGIFCLTISENKKLIDLAFEAFSAFGTVGLSRGITSSLSEFGKIIIILLMFIGRVGPIAFLYTFVRIKDMPAYDLPEENISIL